MQRRLRRAQLGAGELEKRLPGRPWETRVGTIALEIAELRQGIYFPGWLPEPRRRAEKALTAVVAEVYHLVVSTREVEDMVQALGIDKLSKSQVSLLAKELDGVVKSFRERPLAGPPRRIRRETALHQCLNPPAG